MSKLIRAHNEPGNAPRPKDQLPHARLHDLRHIHATTLLLSGVPVHVVAARLGHADPAITLRVYAHVIRSADLLFGGTRADRWDFGLELMIRGLESFARDVGKDG